VTLAYDHRVMDGALVADALQRLEQILVTEIAAELRELTTTRLRSDSNSIPNAA
jgi:hypothetical protein